MAENGDVRQRLLFTISAECDRLDFVSFHDAVDWDWPAKHRDRVRIEVRSPEVDGVGGARLDVTHRRSGDRRLRSFIHFDRPLTRGEEFTAVVEVFWPAMCLPFVLGHGPDRFTSSFGETARLVSHRVLVPKKWAVKFEHVGVLPGRDDYALTVSHNARNQVEASLTVRDVPGYRKVGLKFDTARTPA
ncbi:hypothetical protein [Saccharothrix sp. Mg75]|uniref:hypothetical protein n=1 Tax=Saccharothrix sp. Mg75 TaxID=3445357 RepID=UPI003EED7586